ncbi:hypothetical protein N7475_005356 [Penicillium sp. IBT 31633x]|nr:hypothetical protein N7475_005356 [Penicillium sp. IBT 31633x]
MAPILGHNNTLFSRGAKKYETNMERELVLTKLILGSIVVVFGILLGYTVWLQLKPKYKEEWRPKLKSKLRDYKEKYGEYKKKFGARNSHKESSKLTTDLTPEYMKRSTAVMYTVD